MKPRMVLPVVLASVLVAIFLVSPSSAVGPSIPPPPYFPHSPEEDIVMFDAYITQGTPNVLHLTVTLAVPTPPSGQSLMILVTRLVGSTEEVIHTYIYNGPAKTVHSFDVTLKDGGNVDIALYVMLGTLGTDRAPKEGFFSVTFNQRTYYDNVGGVVLPTGNLAVLSPYLALIGLVTATAAVAFERKRMH